MEWPKAHLQRAWLSATQKAASLTRSSFVGGVFAVLTGTSIAHIVSIASAPVLTRLFSPETFGVLGVFNFALSILTPVAVLNYHLGIVLAPNEKSAIGLVHLSIIISMFISLLLLAIMALQGSIIVELLQLEVLEPYIYLVPLAVFATGIQQVFHQWGLRQEAFKTIGIATAVQSAIVNFSKVALGFVQPVAGILVTATAVAPLILAALLVYRLPRVRLPTFKAFSRLLLWLYSLTALARRYRAFPKFRTPQTILQAVTFGIPIVLLLHYDGITAVGHYTVAMQLLMVPSLFIGNAVASVFYPKFSKAIRDKANPAQLLRQSTFGMAILGIIPYGSVLLFGPWLFSQILGADWRASGELSQWLAIWLFFWFCSRPCMNAVPALRLESRLLLWEVVGSVLRPLAFLLGFAMSGDSSMAILAFSLMGSLLNIALIGFVHLRVASMSVS